MPFRKLLTNNCVWRVFEEKVYFCIRKKFTIGCL